MTKLCLLLLVAVTLALVGGCATEPSGDREFIPGKGWEPIE